MATIASYLPFPAAGVMGEAALRALGETSDSDFAMAMALSAVPGGKLAAVLGKATGAMWRGAMHYAGKTAAGRFLGRAAGGLMDKARELLRRKPPGACGCFAAGTIVWTSHGAVPIEQVKVGDLVLAKDEQSGELVFRLVTAEIVTRQAALLDLSLEQEGREIRLRTTDEHPFWVEGRGWMRADALVPGSMVDTLGGPATVLALSFTGERTTVHNISVEGNQNYFVGADGVWVHNTQLCWPRAADTKSISDLPQQFRGWPTEFNEKTGALIFRDPENQGRMIRFMPPTSHKGAIPAKHHPDGYVVYSDGYGGSTHLPGSPFSQ
jgi:hypothetical protein